MFRLLGGSTIGEVNLWFKHSQDHDLAFFELFGNDCQSCKLGWQPFNQSGMRWQNPMTCNKLLTEHDPFEIEAVFVAGRQLSFELTT
jgi:hypothetical protein